MSQPRIREENNKLTGLDYSTSLRHVVLEVTWRAAYLSTAVPLCSQLMTVTYQGTQRAKQDRVQAGRPALNLNPVIYY